MSVFEIIIAGLAYVVIGMIVVESARIWFGMWWLELRLSAVLFWPFIVFAVLTGRRDG